MEPEQAKTHQFCLGFVNRPDGQCFENVGVMGRVMFSKSARFCT